MNRYLDALDGIVDPAPLPVPARSRVLGALGPKMLELAARRSAGAHPFLVTPEHTRRAREILGNGPLLAPEQKVVLVDAGQDRVHVTPGDQRVDQPVAAAVAQVVRGETEPQQRDGVVALGQVEVQRAAGDVAGGRRVGLEHHLLFRRE